MVDAIENPPLRARPETEAQPGGDLVLALGQPSPAYREGLGRLLGNAPYVMFDDLMSRGPLGLARFLLATRPRRITVAIEYAESIVMAPYLIAIAGMTRSRRLQIATPDLRIESLSRLRVPQAIGAIAAAYVDGRRAAGRARTEVDALLGVDRFATRPAGGEGAVLYVRTGFRARQRAGGSFAHTAGVVNGLLRRGHPVDMVTLQSIPLLDAEANVRVIVPARAHAFPKTVNPYRYDRNLRRGAERVGHERGHSFVYGRVSGGYYAPVAVSRALGIPLVAEYNSSEAWAARNWESETAVDSSLLLDTERAWLRHAHLVVTVSEVLVEELLERGVPRERIVVYPNCVDSAVFDPGRFSASARAGLREQLGIPADGLVVTFIGTFGQWHGIEVLADTIAEMVARDEAWLRRQRVHFLLIGSGHMMGRVQATLDGDRTGTFVNLTGLIPQDEAALHLAISDIVVSPHVNNPDGTRFFGSPTKLVEYMAMGKSIVASDLEQIGQTLSPGLHVQSLPTGEPSTGSEELAVLVPPRSVDGLAAGIRFLAEQPGWREVLGRNARAAALSRFTWEKHVDAILAGLRRVMDSE